MDNQTIIRIAALAVAAVLVFIIIKRRRSKASK